MQTDTTCLPFRSAASSKLDEGVQIAWTPLSADRNTFASRAAGQSNRESYQSIRAASPNLS
jgi:hypothetical protein